MTKFIRAIIYAIIAIPLVLTPFTVFPHHFGKAFIFQILVDLGLIVLAVKVWREGLDINLKNNRLLSLFSIVVAIMFVASLFGENFVRSFEGTYFRNNGIVLWLHLLGFFFILSQVIRHQIEWRRILSFFVIIGTLIATIGIGQHFFTIWPGLLDQSGRIFSTIGNPIFFGAYLLFPLFFAWYLVATSTARKEKILWTVFSFINLVAIYFTESGGIFVGLASGIFIFVAVMVVKGRLPHFLKNKLVVCGLAVILSLILILTLFDFKIFGTKWVKLFPPLDRVANISFNAGTGETRVWAWQMAIEGIKNRPWFGWGVANFETVADRYYNPRFFEHSFAETVWDRPHNIFLEVAVEQGLIGLVVYLGLFAATYILISRAPNWTPVVKGLMAGLLTAYLVQNFFGLDTVSSLISLVILLVFIGSTEPLKESNGLPQETRKAICVIIVTLSLISIGAWSIQPLWASYYVQEVEAVAHQDGEAWEENALRVLSYRGPYADQFKLALARDILAWDGKDNLPYLDLKKGYRALLTGLEEAVSNRPDHFNYYYYLGQAYQIEAEHGDKSYFDKSVVMLAKAQTLSPDRQAVSFVLAKNYFLANDFVKAKEVLEKIINQYPNNSDANLYYGLVLSKLGEYANAADSFIKVIETKDYSVDTRTPRMIGQIIEGDRQYDKLITYYHILSTKNPLEPLWLLDLAKAYYLAGKLKEAEATIDVMRILVKDSGHNLDAIWNKFKVQTKK